MTISCEFREYVRESTKEIIEGLRDDFDEHEVVLMVDNFDPSEYAFDWHDANHTAYLSEVFGFIKDMNPLEIQSSLEHLLRCSAMLETASTLMLLLARDLKDMNAPLLHTPDEGKETCKE